MQCITCILYCVSQYCTAQNNRKRQPLVCLKKFVFPLVMNRMTDYTLSLLLLLLLLLLIQQESVKLLEPPLGGCFQTPQRI